LQRFVCGGSRVVRGVAGKPRFGRSLSLYHPFAALSLAQSRL
jgi:hypothetical protein